MSSQKADTPKYIAYVGCYTLPGQADPFQDTLGGVPHDTSKVGKGILAMNISKDGHLSYATTHGEPVITSIPNPSYLTVVESKSSHYLCIVSEVGEKEGKTLFYSIQSSDPTKLQQITIGEEETTTLPTNGSYPCHITSITPRTGGDLSYVFVSNYGCSGTDTGITMYKMECNNTGTKESTNISLIQTITLRNKGSGVAKSDRQVSSHAHSCFCIKNSTANDDTFEVFTSDLGSDAIIRYRLKREKDDTNGLLEEVGRLAIPLGSGPRSMVFNPSSNHSNIGIVSLEMTAEIILVQCRTHDGCLETIGTPYSVLPSGWPDRSSSTDHDMLPYNDGKWASDVVWSQNGQYAFAAARLHNSISIFKLVISDTTKIHLEFVDRISTGGITPRCLEVSPCGAYLLIAHQHSHDISSFHIDDTTGKLTFVDKIDVPLAACIKMISPPDV